MELLDHLGISSALFGICYALTHSWICLLIFPGGFLIDLDHLFDYCIFNGFRFYSPSSEHYIKAGRIMVLAHSLELLLIASIVFGTYHWPWLGFLLLGYWVHIGLDICYNYLNFKMSPWNYFFFYRAMHKFDLRHISPHILSSKKGH